MNTHRAEPFQSGTIEEKYLLTVAEVLPHTAPVARLAGMQKPSLKKHVSTKDHVYRI